MEKEIVKKLTSKTFTAEENIWEMLNKKMLEIGITNKSQMIRIIIKSYCEEGNNNEQSN